MEKSDLNGTVGPFLVSSYAQGKYCDLEMYLQRGRQNIPSSRKDEKRRFIRKLRLDRHLSDRSMIVQAGRGEP